MGPDRPTQPESRPGEEIEVTPAMVVAGEAVYWASDRRLEDMSTILSRVFRAMVGARAVACRASLGHRQ